MEEKIIRAKVKGYNVLKGALDGDIEYNTIIRTINKLGDLEMNKEFDNNYDYYIYEKDRMFHRCNKDGKLGAKYQDRFLNYKVLEKDFEFYKILEEEKKIPEKIDIYEDEEGPYFIDKHCKKIYITCDEINFMVEEFNQLIDYLKSKGDE